MKVYADKLLAQISKSLAPIYVVSGDEPLLVQESCDLIRENLKKRGYAERDLFHVDASFDWEQVLFSANSMSLFAENKFLELRIPSGKPGDKGAKALASYMESIPDDTVMLIVLPKVDASTQRTKWFKALESKSVFVQIWPIEVGQLPRWINDRFSKVGLRASTDAVQALIERIEGNLLAAVQEIERLRLIAPNDEVDLELVVEGVSDNARYDVFGLLDAAVGQDPHRSIKIIRGLRAESGEIMFVVAMLAKELRTLAAMADSVSQGQKIDSVLQSHRVWAKRKPIVGRCLQRQKTETFQVCLQGVAKIDAQIKGVIKGDPWDELERIMLRLAGKPSTRLT